MSEKGSSTGVIFLVILVIGVFTVALLKTPVSVLFGGSSVSMGTATVSGHIKPAELAKTGAAPQTDIANVVAKKTQPTETKVVSEVNAELKVPGMCIACHGTGVAGAPKIGDKSAWEERAKQGIDKLIISAAKGKGNMPPQGVSFNNDQIKQAIKGMLSRSGLNK